MMLILWNSILKQKKYKKSLQKYFHLNQRLKYNTVEKCYLPTPHIYAY